MALIYQNCNPENWSVNGIFFEHVVLQFVRIHLKISLNQHGTQTEQGQWLKEIPVINMKDGFEKKHFWTSLHGINGVANFIEKGKCSWYTSIRNR